MLCGDLEASPKDAKITITLFVSGKAMTGKLMQRQEYYSVLSKQGELSDNIRESFEAQATEAVKDAAKMVETLSSPAPEDPEQAERQMLDLLPKHAHMKDVKFDMGGGWVELHAPVRIRLSSVDAYFIGELVYE